MAIQKEVVLQLKVIRPADSKALADAAREAQKLDQSIKSAGTGASKALADATTQARRFHQEVRSAQMTASRGVGGSATGGGAVGGAGYGGARPGMGGMAGSFLFAGENPLRRVALPVMAASAAQGIGSSMSRVSASSMDAQFSETMRRESPGSFVANEIGRSIPIIGSIGGGLADLATWGARSRAEASTRQMQERLRRQEIARQRQQIVTAGELSRAEATRAGARDLYSAHIGGRAGIMAAGERASALMADRRFEGIGRRFGDEMDAGSLSGGAMAEMRAEIGRRSDFGRAERFRIEEERRAAQSDLARASTPLTGTDPGGTREADRLRQVEEARRRILDLERQDVDLTRQAGENETQRLERIRQFMQTAEQGYLRIAEHERARTQNFREQFGLMDEIGRMEVRQLAERASARGGAGIQGLSADELGRLRETGLFDEQVRGEAARRGNLAGAQAIIRASGAEGREEAARSRAREAAGLAASVENTINVAINVNGQDVARQVSERVESAIAQLTLSTAARLEEQIERALQHHETQKALQANGKQQ